LLPAGWHFCHRPLTVKPGRECRILVGHRIPSSMLMGIWKLHRAIAADEGAGSSEIQDVYATAGAIAAYRPSRQFPDGTVLIKEVYETAKHR